MAHPANPAEPADGRAAVYKLLQLSPGNYRMHYVSMHLAQVACFGKCRVSHISASALAKIFSCNTLQVYYTGPFSTITSLCLRSTVPILTLVWD